MRRTLVVLLLSLCMPAMASISKQSTQQIFNQLARANNIQAQLGFIETGEYSQEINAFGAPGSVYVTAAMLKYADRDIMIAVLAHELAHASGHRGELEADIYSGRIGNAAGLNVCPGAKKFLLHEGLEGGDGVHPNGDVRLKAMCK